MKISEITIEGLEADLYARNKIINEFKTTEQIETDRLNGIIDDLQDEIRGLEAELSARKGDSEVLMKVVEAIRELRNLSGMTATYDLRHIRDMLVDYLDAPEGPDNTARATYSSDGRLIGVEIP